MQCIFIFFLPEKWKHYIDQLNCFYFASWYIHILRTVSTFDLPVNKKELKRKETMDFLLWVSYLSLSLFVIVFILGRWPVHGGYMSMWSCFSYNAIVFFLRLKQVLVPTENIVSEGCQCSDLHSSRCYTFTLYSLRVSLNVHRRSAYWNLVFTNAIWEWGGKKQWTLHIVCMSFAPHA